MSLRAPVNNLRSRPGQFPNPSVKIFNLRLELSGDQEGLLRPAKHSKVYIAGERQLDERGFPALYLCVLLLEKVRTAGISLPELVVPLLREQLKEERARGTFEEKLLSFGCLDVHFARYDQRYLFHRIRAFAVTTGFPRMQPPLPDGVGDLTYSIALSACSSFEVDMSALRDVIAIRN